MPVAKNDDLIAEHTLLQPTVSRFWANVITDTDCWYWQKACNSGGYGMFSIQNKVIAAHRFAYVSHYGPIADPAEKVRQTCQNKACVRPSHLALGSDTRTETVVFRVPEVDQARAVLGRDARQNGGKA